MSSNHSRIQSFFTIFASLTWLYLAASTSWAQSTVESLQQEPQVESAALKKATPEFKDGEAQIVEEFKNPRDWIWHDLWVETEFDSDGTGTPDRMHVSVCRPRQTETEGLKVPVIYVYQPLFFGDQRDRQTVLLESPAGTWCGTAGTTKSAGNSASESTPGHFPISHGSVGAKRFCRRSFGITRDRTFSRMPNRGW
jgi:hypothetical protein